MQIAALMQFHKNKIMLLKIIRKANNSLNSFIENAFMFLEILKNINLF